MTDFKARLVRFYNKYAPDKLDGVDELLAKSKGKEEKLFAKLVEKYGPEPTASSAPEPTISEDKAKGASSISSSSKKSSSKKRQEEEEEEEEQQAEDGDGGVKKDATGGDDEAVQDDYGTRPWWKARLVRFYAKYAPEKTDADIEALLTKAKDNPVQLTKLFQMLEQKYGPEPDPSSEEEDEEDDEAEEAEAEEDEDDEDKYVEVAGLRKIVYCPVDGVPPEYSEYFETFNEALPWLAGNVPDLVLHTKQGKTVAVYAKEQGVEPLSEGAKVAKADKAKERKRGGGARKTDGKIVVEMQERRKKAITTVKGLDGIEGIKMKDAAKALGKKFASGAAVKTGNAGDEYIEIQGDFSYELPQVLIDLFSGVKKDMVYTVDEDGKKQPAF